MSAYDYKKGLIAMAACYLIWGFRPLYFNLCSEIDTLFLMAGRIIWAGVILYVLNTVYEERKKQ